MLGSGEAQPLTAKFGQAFQSKDPQPAFAAEAEAQANTAREQRQEFSRQSRA